MGNTSILKKFETFNLDKAGKEINEILNTAVKEGDLKAVQETITEQINASISELEKNLDNKATKNDVDAMISGLNASKLDIRTIISEQDKILDLDDYTDNGIYILDNKIHAENQPESDVDGGMLVVLQYPTGEDNNVVVQIAYWTNGEAFVEDDDPLPMIRQYARGRTIDKEWTKWNLVANTETKLGGFKGGRMATATHGGAVGNKASASRGGAVGAGAKTSSGFAGGMAAKTQNETGEAIDAIQLGTGTNPNEKTLQVYHYQLMDKEGMIPANRFPRADIDTYGVVKIEGYDDSSFGKRYLGGLDFSEDGALEVRTYEPCGIGIDPMGGSLCILKSNEEDIDKRESWYKPIVPANLEYAVESCTGEKGKPDGYAPLDSNGKLPEEYLYGTTVKQYGVRWDGTSSTACERLGDAVGLVANAHHGTVDSVRNDFDDIYPWSDMRLCNIDDDGNILAYAGEPTFATDGSNGDVMVEIPKFYYKRVKEKDENGEYLPSEEIWICKLNLPGYELHPLFIDNGREVNKVFHSAYNPAKVNDNGGTILRSIAGVLPANNSPRKTYRNMAKARNTSSDKVIWGIEDLICISALQMLYLVEYADTNCQKTVGRGFSASTYDNMPANGSCNSLNGKSGYIGEDGKSDVSYRGIEGIWGKIYRLLDGANVKDYIVYYCNSIKDYDDVSFDGKYKANTYENASRKDKGHVSRLGYNQNAPWLLFPEDVGGSNATYIPDSYFGASGEKVIMFGGNYNSGYGSGLFYYGCNNGLDTYSINNGTHLVVKTI